MGNEIEAHKYTLGNCTHNRIRSVPQLGKWLERMRLIWKIKENNSRGISNHDNGHHSLNRMSLRKRKRKRKRKKI